MLSENEKQKIRAEEIYREEIRSELGGNTKKGYITSFLDTQHGLFIASAIVLPFMLWLFALLQSHYSAANEDKALTKLIDYEISYRINNFLALDRGSLRTFKTELSSRYAYPQFSGIKIRGLMLQLADLVPESEKKEVTRAISALASGRAEDIQSHLKIRNWVIK